MHQSRQSLVSKLNFTDTISTSNCNNLGMMSAEYRELKLQLLIAKEQETQLGILRCYLTL